MKVELDKSDLISLLTGISPSYEMMNNPIVKLGGSYTGGFVDAWRWDSKYKLENVRDEDLWATYLVMKGKR